jgi:hypothetical protein
MRSTRRLSLLAAAAAALLIGAADARAEEVAPDPLDNVPALGEYVEDIPTATGKKATTKPAARPKTTTTTTKKKTTEPSEEPAKEPTEEPAKEPAQEPETQTLPKNVAKRISKEGGSLAPKLKKIATSPRYGAEKRRPKSRRADRVLGAPQSEATPTARAFGTALTAGFGGGDRHMSVLLVTLLVTTAAAAAAAGYRRPRSRTEGDDDSS